MSAPPWCPGIATSSSSPAPSRFTRLLTFSFCSTSKEAGAASLRHAAGSVRFQSGNRRDSAVKPATVVRLGAARKHAVCREICGEKTTPPYACHAEGRGFESLQPLSKNPFFAGFSLRQSPCSSASGRTDSGLAVRRSSAASRENARCRPILARPNGSRFCRPAEARVFYRLRPIAGFLQTTPLADGCLPARWQRSRSAGGRVRFQSGNREVDLGRSATRPANRAPARELSPQGGVRGRAPAWAVAIARVTAEGVASIGSGRLLATGPGSPSSSQRRASVTVAHLLPLADPSQAAGG